MVRCETGADPRLLSADQSVSLTSGVTVTPSWASTPQSQSSAQSLAPSSTTSLSGWKAMPPLAPNSYQAPDKASVVARADRPLSNVISCAFGYRRNCNASIESRTDLPAPVGPTMMVC